MDRTNRNEDKPSRIESQQKPPSISDAFMHAFADMLRPPLLMRVETKIEGRGYELHQVLMRCVEVESGCWEWQGAATKKGYGRVKVAGKLYSPHRVVAWATGIAPAMGDPSRKTVVMHSCDNPKCCNPKHLSLGSHSDNMLDCARKGRLVKRSA